MLETKKWIIITALFITSKNTGTLTCFFSFLIYNFRHHLTHLTEWALKSRHLIAKRGFCGCGGGQASSCSDANQS